MPYSDLPTTKLDEVSLTLLRAADYIEERGWCQLRYHTRAGHVCAYGAILSIEGDISVRRKAEVRFSRFHDVLSMENYNDAPGRTKEEVVAALRAAAYGGER